MLPVTLRNTEILHGFETLSLKEQVRLESRLTGKQLATTHVINSFEGFCFIEVQWKGCGAHEGCFLL